MICDSINITFAKMKQVISIIAALFYLLSTNGLVAYVHTCHGDVTEINILAKSDCCSSPDSEIHKNCSHKDEVTHTCCSDKEYLIKYNPDSVFSNEEFKLSKPVLDSFLCNDFSVEVYEKEISTEFCEPSTQQKDLTTLYCSFTFYG